MHALTNALHPAVECLVKVDRCSAFRRSKHTVLFLHSSLVAQHPGAFATHMAVRLLSSNQGTMPSLTCVSCRRGSRQVKLLRCLHSVCVACLETHLSSLNEVTCPSCKRLTPAPSRGHSQLLALPNSCTAAFEQSHSPSAQQFCDECGENEPAKSLCWNCKVLFCELHASAHAKSRSTLHHRVEGLAHGQSGAALVLIARRADIPKPCISHPSYILNTFCTSCRHLLCEMCLKIDMTCNECGTAHVLLPVAEAAEQMRDRVKQKMTGSAGGDQGGVIFKAIEDMESSISQLHERTEALSEQVVEYFGAISRVLKERETAILEKLDRLRSAKLLPLEQQKLRLQDHALSHDAVAMLLTCCHDDWDFLRMASWLEEAASEAIASASNDLKPAVRSNLVFSEDDPNTLSAAIASAGDVLDAAEIDPRKSRVECTTSIRLGDELVILMNVVTGDKHVVTADDVNMRTMQVTVRAPDGGITSCTVRPGEGKGVFVSKNVPAAPGNHHVTVQLGAIHLAGSPITLTVAERGFNPSRCHGSIEHDG